MVLTPKKIKEFEEEQEQYGTKTALSNFIFILCGEMLKDIGVQKVKITYKEEKK